MTAVSLACWWARSKQDTLLADLDDQDTGSATWWLDRTDDRLETLRWVEASANELVDSLDRIEAQRIVVDTPPRIRNHELIKVAELVDLVLIPGLPSEAPSITQTAKTIAANTDTPTAAVITRTPTQTMHSSEVVAVADKLGEIGCPTVGQIRLYQAMAKAPIEGRRPLQLAGTAGAQLADDLQKLAEGVERMLTNA